MHQKNKSDSSKVLTEFKGGEQREPGLHGILFYVKLLSDEIGNVNTATNVLIVVVIVIHTEGDGESILVTMWSDVGRHRYYQDTLS